MKKNFLYLTILMLCIVSCKKDFITLSSENQLSSDTFYKTKDQFDKAVIGTYSALRDWQTTTSSWIMGEMRSDNTHYELYNSDRGNATTNRENVADFIDDSQNVYTAGNGIATTQAKYALAYKGIQRANIILDRVGSSSMSDAEKSSATGHAKFLRAFFYFDLVQYYGGVPLFLHEVTNEVEAYLPRATADEVYNAIIADAKDAIQKLPAPTAFPQSGLATSGSAKMLLANVYMVQKKYAEAEVLLREITTMGYSLLPDYASVYALANKNSRESIFEVQYQQGTQGVNSAFTYSFIPRMASTTAITGVNSNSTSTGGWNVPTQDLISAYESGDKRLDASIAIAEGVNDASGNFQGQALKSIIGYTTPAGKISKPFIRKYLHAHTIVLNTDDNWPVYRYAEALLFLAEALNELNRSSEALPYLNQVRTRAGLGNVSTTGQATLRDVILHERRIELAFENKRWLDLLRTANAIPVMTAFGVKQKQLYGYLASNSYQVTSNRLLFPIPIWEIQRNTKMVQNPGY